MDVKAQIEALRKAETIQLKRLEKVEAKLQAEMKRQQASTKARAAKSTKTATKSRRRTKSDSIDQEKENVARLEAIVSQTEIDVQQLNQKEHELEAKAEALRQAELEQLKRIETAKAQMRAREAAMQALAEEEAQLSASLITVEVQSEAEVYEQPETSEFAFVDEFGIVNGFEEILQPVVEASDTADASELLLEAEISLQDELAEISLQDELSRLQETAEPAMETYETQATQIPETSESINSIQRSYDDPTSRLVEDLKTGDPVSRAAVLTTLSRFNEDTAFNLITSLFDDDSAEVRNSAARALYEFKTDRAGSFTRALRDALPQRRKHIASAINLSGLADEAINMLGGESREKTYDAFSLLFLMAKAGEVQPLLQAIEKHSDVAVRLSVIKLLTFSNQPDIIPAFRSLAVRASLPTEVRSAVMEAIYQISRNAREGSLSAA